MIMGNSLSNRPVRRSVAKQSHSERSRGIPVVLPPVMPRGPSTALRSAQDDKVSINSFGAGADNRLRAVHIAVAPLKFGLQFDGKPRKIDKIPAREFPHCVRRT